MIKNLTFLLAIYLASSFLLVSAQQQADSIQAVIDGQPKDTASVSSYLSIYHILKFEDADRAREALTNALELSESQSFQKGKLKTLMAIGELLETESRYDSALATYQIAQSIAGGLENRKGIMRSYVGQGSVFSSLQRLDEADSVTFLCIELALAEPADSMTLINCYTILSNTAYFRSEYDKSIAFDQKSLTYNANDPLRKAKSFANIGSTHDILGNHDRSIEYYLKGLEQAKLAEDERMIALIRMEIGLLKSNMELYDEAKTYYELAMEHFETVNDQAMKAHLNHNLGKLYIELKDFDLAVQKLKTALDIINEVPSPWSKGHFTYQLGLAYFEKKDYPQAERYYLEAKSIFDETKDANMQAWVLSRLSDLYAASEDYKQAFSYLQSVKAMDDSTFIANKEKNIAELEEKYQNEQKQQEIDLLSAENQIAELELKEQANLRNYLIAAAFLLVILIGLLYNRYQLKARANAKLKELDSIKTNFFTNISHEFRTPLTLILSPLQRLLNQDINHETKEELKVIHRNATVLTELTNQLLDLSKLEAGKLSLMVSEGNFKTFMKVLSASFESLAVAQKVEFITDIEAAPEVAYFDEDKVQKILNNLLSNAFKFTSNEGKVILRVVQEQSEVSITITDTGKGISPAEQALIFQRFYQNQSGSSGAAGTGVGLTLSKELALLHKGDITVKSEPEKGASFTFRFPFNQSAYAQHQIVSSDESISQSASSVKPFIPIDEPDEPSSTDKIILIVEDNPDLRNHMRSLLKEDYVVKESVNGKEGIADALEIVPDIIISDLMMPEVDGVELCDSLKTNEKTSHIPIILLTAKADRDTKLEGLKTGADDFLTKPFDNEELTVRIQNLITQRETLQEKFMQTLALGPAKIAVDSPDELFIKKALQQVEDHLSDSTFTVELFQTEMGMSRMQLHRKLKALTNFSASEFIRDIRLQRAADLLGNNGLNVTEVAYSCGFNSGTYFTQCFTEKYGITPSKYRKKAS